MSKLDNSIEQLLQGAVSRTNETFLLVALIIIRFIFYVVEPLISEIVWLVYSGQTRIHATVTNEGIEW